MRKDIAIGDLEEKINSLSVTEVLKLFDSYGKATGTDVSKRKAKLISADLQNRLKEHGMNSCCPQCGSIHVVGFGSNGHVNRFLCRDCNKTFTLFTGTILEKTKHSWDVWIAVTEMVLNHKPIEHIQDTLIKDYGLENLNYKSVFLWVHKLIHAMAAMPMPKLTGTIQIDETFFRESQKGSRKLVSYVKDEKREPRYGRIPSKMGTMGNEFANVVCMTDLRGYSVAKLVSLGKLTVEAFYDLFDEYIENPTFICTDANTVYKEYCKLKNYPHYIKPSNYLEVINKHGLSLQAEQIVSLLKGRTRKTIRYF